MGRQTLDSPIIGVAQSLIFLFRAAPTNRLGGNGTPAPSQERTYSAHISPAEVILILGGRALPMLQSIHEHEHDQVHQLADLVGYDQHITYALRKELSAQAGTGCVGGDHLSSVIGGGHPDRVCVLQHDGVVGGGSMIRFWMRSYMLRNLGWRCRADRNLCPG